MAHPLTTQEDIQLIKDLHAISKKTKNLVKSTEYAAPADPQIKIRSWKMQEWKYYEVPTPFPTLARGIFTVEANNAGHAHDRIVIRGYDKFFNIGEVPWTTWAALEAHTVPPYIMSLKSNGCIIFIGALTPKKLLVTSKHAVGDGPDGHLSHAQAGEKWLRKYLEDKGRAEADMAKVLWDNNWTAVAELCDDSFEEHVLPYRPELTGLHLHGINLSSKVFKTLPHEKVDAFADEWGFIKTPTATCNSIDEVEQFRDEVAETKKWRGEAVEGFVVRTHIGEVPHNKKANAPPNKSPYVPGDTFFFKIKFDEPYMMYRDWREVTKSLLSKYDKATRNLTPGMLPKKKMARPITKLYAQWVIDQIKLDRRQFNGYTQNHGIIATRGRFLKWLEQEKGIKESDLAHGENTVGKGVARPPSAEFGKTIILPIAVPGCGKTAIALALHHLFGFAHTQSDDVKAKKKAADVFLNNVSDLLTTNDVVIADKNNHLKRHRQQLHDLIRHHDPPVRLLALDWSYLVENENTRGTVYDVCRSRVSKRGSNHQTLRADSVDKTHEEVIQKFISAIEPLDEDEVDESVEMLLEDGTEMRDAVRHAVEGIVSIIPGLEMPTDKQIDDAVRKVEEYKVQVSSATLAKEEKERQKAAEKKKGTPPRYYGLVPELNLIDFLDPKLTSQEGVPEEAKEMWEALRNADRVVEHPHITLVHSKAISRASLEGNKAELKDLWDRCASISSLPSPPRFKVKLGRLVWNGRVMAVSVDDIVTADSDGDVVQEFVTMLKGDVRERLHVTVGTRRKDIMPVESKEMIEAWRAGKTAEISSLDLGSWEVEGTIKGLIQ